MVKMATLGRRRSFSKSVELCGKKIDYIVEYRKVKNARLHFSGGNFLVIIPERLGDGSELKFLAEKSKWILKKHAMAESVSQIVDTHLSENKIPLLGEKFSIVQSEKFFMDSAEKIIGMDFRNVRHVRKSVRLFKKMLADEINSALEKYDGFAGSKKFKVSIRQQRTRWASCSPNEGRLSFNLKMAFIPKDFVEYIVFHELSHTREMRHNGRFWNLIEKRYPNFKEYERDLPKHWLMAHFYIKNFFSLPPV